MDQIINAGPNTDYKKLLTDVIKKQIVILGPSITIAKARNVKGMTVADDGTVTEISGSPQEIIQSLIDQFIQLSGLIVRKTMEPLLANYPDGIPTPGAGAQTPNPIPQPQPPVQPQPSVPQPQTTPQPTVTPQNETATSS